MLFCGIDEAGDPTPVTITGSGELYIAQYV